jgi:hypothetical protein
MLGGYGDCTICFPVSYDANKDEEMHWEAKHTHVYIYQVVTERYD